MSRPLPKVLLVDDTEANLLVLDAALNKLSCERLKARSGNEALKLLLKHEFAVALLDVQMAEMDGFEVARLARENPVTRQMPIIFVTAIHESEAITLKGYGVGAVDFLFKPFNAEILRSKVQVFLDLYVTRRGLAEEIEAHKATLAELDAFNYSISHDLRAPLRPLDGFSQALLDDYGDKLDAQAKDWLQRIQAAAGRMGQLIDDLLRLSRLTRAELRKSNVDVSALAESVMTEIRAHSPKRDTVWNCAPGLRAEADARLLQIVLENLLRNAWKFSSKQASPHIELGDISDGATRAFFVRDNGAGFDPDHSDRLFQPFQRLHTQSEFEGTGIGLALCQRIIRRHGGRIWAESKPGAGATFFFTLGSS